MRFILSIALVFDLAAITRNLADCFFYYRLTQWIIASFDVLFNLSAVSIRPFLHRNSTRHLKKSVLLPSILTVTYLTERDMTLKTTETFEVPLKSFNQQPPPVLVHEVQNENDDTIRSSSQLQFINSQLGSYP